MRDRLLHDTSGFHHLRQKHFALAEQIADDVHAIHQRAFNHVDRATTATEQFLPGFFGIFDYPLRDAMHQRVRQAFLDRFVAPFQVLLFFFATRFQAAGDFYHALGGVRTSIEHHVFHSFAQLGF